MAVSISVSQVREQLVRAGGRATGEGTPTTKALGSLFHRLVAVLLDADSSCSLQNVLQDLEPDLELWKKKLREHTYDQILGPLLTQSNASLQGDGPQVLTLWTSVQQLTDWLAHLWWTVSKEGKESPEQSKWFFAEQPVVCELKRPDWKEHVLLLGQTDAVLKRPGSESRWCVIDWKTGRTAPEVDLLQACLYHMMLHQNGNGQDSAVAVVSFTPELKETVFAASEIAEARERLLDVIESLAKKEWEKSTTALTVSKEDAKVAAVALEATPTVERASSRTSVPVSKTTPVTEVISKPTIPEVSGHSEIWQKERLKELLKVLAEFNAPVKQIRSPAVGPTFVRFFVMPERGITSSRVISLRKELHLRLALEQEPVMTVTDGSIAVDLPRPDRLALPFSTLVPHLPAIDPLFGKASLPVGMDLSGNWKWCDLAASESCHLLVVGTPGSGKSEWLRAAVATLLATNTAETLDLLLIDPKRNAFGFAEGASQLRCPVVKPGGDREVAEILDEVIEEMDARIVSLDQSNSKTLTAHIKATGQHTKRTVIVCDEYSDLLDTCSRKGREAIEARFKRLAQVGRAPGFHILLATQQPRANVITPAIKALIPAKVALRVASPLESRVAIDEGGAENLLGNGDLIYKCIGSHRYQGAFLPTEEEPLVFAHDTAQKPVAG